MHYYKFNIADWALHTAHLSLEEEAIYFRLINHYYDTEQPIPLETQPVIRRLRLGNDSDLVNVILSEYFVKTEKGFVHNRCETLLKEYRKTAKKNKANGAKGGRPKKDAASVESQEEPSGLFVGSQEEPKHNPNQEPLTINQKLKTKPNPPAKPKYEDVDLKFATQAFELIKQNNPDHKEPNLKSWASDVRKMREIDKRDLNEMARVWTWIRQDHFWSTNILSISKFREKYDQLKLKSNQVNDYAKHERPTPIRPDNSASGRVRQNAAKRRAEIAAEIAEIDGNDRPLATNGLLVRP